MQNLDRLGVALFSFLLHHDFIRYYCKSIKNDNHLPIEKYLLIFIRNMVLKSGATLLRRKEGIGVYSAFNSLGYRNHDIDQEEIPLSSRKVPRDFSVAKVT